MKYVVLAWIAGLTGFALLITGVAMVSRPTAFIVAGLGLMAWSYLADKASATPASGGG